jgi:ABC-type lipoprotein release transport system permease subunit
MDRKKYIFRSLFYYWKSHFAIFAGCAVTVMVIAGALGVGDSVRHSLLGIVEKRLGNIAYVMISRRYFPRTDLAAEIQDEANHFSLQKNIRTAPALIFQGSALKNGGISEISDVNIIGVDSRFQGLYRKIAKKKAGYPPESRQVIPPGEAIVNKAFADKLQIKNGDTLILRISQPGILPNDVRFVAASKSVITLRIKVNMIADNNFPADFSLKSEQHTPLNLFLSLNWLGLKLKKEGRCNTILVESPTKKGSIGLNKALKRRWKISDIGLKISSGKKSGSILRSKNIFIDKNIAQFALSIPKSEGVMTYFINSFRNLRTKKSTPYSFVSAVRNLQEPFQAGKKLHLSVSDSSTLPRIIISRWLADDLNAETGDTIELKYYSLERMSQVVEKSAKFVVSAITPTQFFADSSYFRIDLPGLTDSKNCIDWNPGIPISLDKIRKKDEGYWDKYKGTPKGVISLKYGREIWKNEFGTLTAVKLPPDSLPIFKKMFHTTCQPKDFGLYFFNIAKKNRAAAEQSIDFGELFLGLSFFIIFSALILTGMLFALSVESRREEIATLYKLGFKYCEISKLIMVEHIFPAIGGTVTGIPLGILYNKLIIYLLNTLWSRIAGTSQLITSMTLSSAVISIFAGLLTAFFLMWFVIHKKFKNLQYAKTPYTPGFIKTKQKRGNSPNYAKNNFPLISGILFSAASLCFVAYAWQSEGRIKPAAPFFAAGGLLLIAFWFFCRYFLLTRSRRNLSYPLTLANRSLRGILSLAMRYCSSRITGSMTAIILLSSGLFIILAVAINMRTSADLSLNSSGTGGYTFFIKTTFPLLYDLRSPEGKKAYNLSDKLFKDVTFLQMPLHEGSDASCLNLNRVQTPAILGVNFAEFAKNNAFTFTAIKENTNSLSPWQISTISKEEIKKQHKIQAIADTNVIIWILGKKVGETIEIRGENGSKCKLQFTGGIAPSVFQGYVLIPKNAYKNLFPSSNESRVVLVKCSKKKINSVEKALNEGLSGLGVKIERCSKRVNRFLTVENTYLTIFLILGGLGMIIGSAGFGIVTIKNITDRKNEFTIMHALGYNKQLLVRIITIEHIYLIIMGALSGGAAAGIAVIPALISARTPIPWGIVSVISASTLFIGILSIYTAAHCMVKKIQQK